MELMAEASSKVREVREKMRAVDGAWNELITAQQEAEHATIQLSEHILRTARPRPPRTEPPSREGTTPVATADEPTQAETQEAQGVDGDTDIWNMDMQMHRMRFLQQMIIQHSMSPYAGKGMGKCAGKGMGMGYGMGTCKGRGKGMGKGMGMGYGGYDQDILYVVVLKGVRPTPAMVLCSPRLEHMLMFVGLFTRGTRRTFLMIARHAL